MSRHKDVPGREEQRGAARHQMTWAVRPSLSWSSLLRGRLRPPGDSHQFTFLVTRLLCGGVVFALRHPPSTDKTRFLFTLCATVTSTQITQKGGTRQRCIRSGWCQEPSLLYGVECLDIRFLQLVGSLGAQTRSEAPLHSALR